MSHLYPDNKNRANRTDQLKDDIIALQSQIEQNLSDVEGHDKASLKFIEGIARKEGFKTVEEYLADAENNLTEEDKKTYEEMRKHFEKKDDRLDLAIKSDLGLIKKGVRVGIKGRDPFLMIKYHSLLTRIIATSLSALLKGSLLRVTLQAIGVGLLRVISGQVKEGTSLLRAAGNILTSAYKGKLVTGRVATALKVLKVAGKVLKILGLVLDGITFIYEVVDGAKQRSEFQEAIKELCARRLTTKKIQEYAHISLSYSSDVQAMFSYDKSLQDEVDSGTFAQAKANEKVAKKLNELDPKISGEMNKIDDESVYKELKEQDMKRKAWTNEDPSLAEIQKMIEGMKEDDKELWRHVALSTPSLWSKLIVSNIPELPDYQPVKEFLSRVRAAPLSLSVYLSLESVGRGLIMFIDTLQRGILTTHRIRELSLILSISASESSLPALAKAILHTSLPDLYLSEVYSGYASFDELVQLLKMLNSIIDTASILPWLKTLRLRGNAQFYKYVYHNVCWEPLHTLSLKEIPIKWAHAILHQCRLLEACSLVLVTSDRFNPDFQMNNLRISLPHLHYLELRFAYYPTTEDIRSFVDPFALPNLTSYCHIMPEEVRTNVWPYMFDPLIEGCLQLHKLQVLELRPDGVLYPSSSCKVRNG
ncbi:hypothetical protein AMATHDRAFT_41834 [Amanita thiersii Skay4041]|uniref:Uncharacterized protein n=1 Tax=Amanita thiersii Skay4041 TaxID=703135 RepID=A0A2A9NEH7_9AGAR|nr:hypothetical protein AMATHDRAFT_41834 [Amanita thiersii Skay4041]